jgi:hypothetical protein
MSIFVTAVIYYCVTHATPPEAVLRGNEQWRQRRGVYAVVDLTKGQQPLAFFGNWQVI